MAGMEHRSSTLIVGRESELAALYPGHPVYLLGRRGSGVEAPFTWRRLYP